VRLVIGNFYPELLNLYGDRGNTECLVRRCQWRSIEVEVRFLGLETDPSVVSECDLLFAGGGPDLAQVRVAQDWPRFQDALQDFADRKGVGLFICGAYQLLGHYYRPAKGDDLPGLGLLDITTQHFGKDKPRCIGNVVVELGASSRKLLDKPLVGFENHGGRTYLGEGVQPLGRVKKGYGNNGEDKTEGAVYKNIIGTYLHGPLLPKNPHLADYLIIKALAPRYSDVQLSKLDDSLEWEAHQRALRLR